MQQAHALTPLLTEDDPPTFPFLTLLASGGHTLLVLAESLNDYRIIADSLDTKIGCVSSRLQPSNALIDKPVGTRSTKSLDCSSFPRIRTGARALSSSHMPRKRRSRRTIRPRCPAYRFPCLAGGKAGSSRSRSLGWYRLQNGFSLP